TRDRILLLLDRAHPEDEPRDAIVLVDLQNAFGKLDPFISLAIGKHRQEGAAEQFVVTGIGAQRGAVVGRRGGSGGLTAPVASGRVGCRAASTGPGHIATRPCRSLMLKCGCGSGRFACSLSSCCCRRRASARVL